MNNEISKKSFVLSIIKLAWTVVALLLLLLIPMHVYDGSRSGIDFIISSYAGIAGGNEAIEVLISWFGVIFWTPFIIVAVIVLIKTVLLFAAVLTQKTGQKLYDETQWRKKFKCISIIPLSVLYFLAITIELEGTSLKLFVPYLAIFYAIADGVICSMLKKSLGISKKKKGVKDNTASSAQ